MACLVQDFWKLETVNCRSLFQRSCGSVSHFGAEWRWGIWGELVEDFGEGMLVNRDGTLLQNGVASSWDSIKTLVLLGMVWVLMITGILAACSSSMSIKWALSMVLVGLGLGFCRLHQTCCSHSSLPVMITSPEMGRPDISKVSSANLHVEEARTDAYDSALFWPDIGGCWVGGVTTLFRSYSQKAVYKSCCSVFRLESWGDGPYAFSPLILSELLRIRTGQVNAGQSSPKEESVARIGGPSSIRQK